MSALAYEYDQHQYTAQPRSRRPRASARARAAANTRRKLPAFPGEDLFFEPKAVDNSMVVRADDPAQRKTSWRAAAAVATAAFIFTGLMLPGTYRMLAGKQIQELRLEQDQLQREISELRALEARHTNLQKLEEVANAQDLIDPAPQMVQHLTPRGAYAMNSLPSGK